MKRWYILSLIILVSSCTTETLSLDDATETAYFYLYNKSLYSDTFSRILYDAPIDFRAVDVEENLLYFVFDRTFDRKKAIMKIAKDTQLVEFAPCETGYCNFGGLEGNVDGIYAVRTPLANLKVDSTITFNYQLKSIKDSLNFVQLKGLLDSQLYYQDKAYMAINSQLAHNLGVLVMKKNEGSLFYKFAKRIKGGATTKEKISQRFVDFVVDEIDYSYEDLWYKAEIMKRPHEVLLSGLGDCSAKTILLASLLEQYDISYCLIYYKNHVNVGIQGDFNSMNNYQAELNGITYDIAETTCPKFQIGKTILEKFELSDMLYYQLPSKTGEIFDCFSNEPKKLYTYSEAVEEFN